MFFKGAKIFHYFHWQICWGKKKEFILGNKKCNNVEGLAFIFKKWMASIQRERNGSMGKIQVWVTNFFNCKVGATFKKCYSTAWPVTLTIFTLTAYTKP